MPVNSLNIDTAWKKIALLACGAICLFASWNFSRWGIANSGASRAPDAEFAAYLTDLAPDDPRPRFSTAVLLERSFDPKDIERALVELDKATALSPNNYLLWLELGRARERSGDAEGAEAALRRSLALAPNYARVQWALGNALLRQGRTDEAFAEIRKAVIGDPALTDSAAIAAWQFFDGDLAKIRGTMTDSPRFDAALASVLAREKQFDKAMELWNRLPPGEKKTSLKDTGTLLLGRMMEGRQFRSAKRIVGDLGLIEADAMTVTNGSFELAVRPENAPPFDWQIAQGLQPQIVINGKESHGGTNSLFLIFNSTDPKDFRQVSQTIAVEPGRNYEFSIFYRSSLKTSAEFRWEIADAVDGKRLAITGPAVPANSWTPIGATFQSPSEGVVIRLTRDGCGQVCPVAGNLWFDDVSIQPIDR